MTQINLLPPEVQTRERTRRHKLAAIGAVGAAVVLILVVFVLQVMRLSALSNDLEEQQRTNSALEGEIGKLQQFEAVQQTLTTKRAMVDGLLSGRVSWSGVLRDASRSLPGDLWLTQLTGQLTTAGTGTTAGSSEIVGSIQYQGRALRGHTTVASWLRRLERIPGWVNPWVSNSSKEASPAGSGGPTTINFAVSVDLSREATVDGRQQ